MSDEHLFSTLSWIFRLLFISACLSILLGLTVFYGTEPGAVMIVGGMMFLFVPGPVPVTGFGLGISDMYWLTKRLMAGRPLDENGN